MSISIIYLSDIHFGLSKEEDQGKVLSSFLDDISGQISSLQSKSIFLVISGDLVQDADETNVYDNFDKKFLNPLLDRIGISHEKVIMVPGNHDIQRNEVSQIKDVYFPFIDNLRTEKSFNDALDNDKYQSFLFDKFKAYDSFAKSVMYNTYNLKSFDFDLGEGWGIFCLNSSIMSSAGLDGRNDQGFLGVDTRSLNKWLQTTRFKHRILVSHHPHNFCSEWVNHEIKNLIKGNFDLVLTGHVHDHELINHINGEENYIHLQSPQLFTHKDDSYPLGYSIIEVSDAGVEQIRFREWFSNRNKFRAGIDFTDEDDGIVHFGNHATSLASKEPKKADNNIDALLQQKLNSAMQAYLGQPYLWVDRFITEDRLDSTFSMTKSNLFSEQDIINNKESFQLIAPPQYGLTCYGLHFALTLWKTANKFPLYLDFTGKTKKFERYINSVLNEFNVNLQNVEWIIIDNWNVSKSEAQVILTYLTKHYADTPIMLLCQYSEQFFIEHEILTSSKTPFKSYYLTPIKFEQMRQISDAYNNLANITDGNTLVNRVDSDIRKLHLHRTPFSCVTLLTVFSESFDESPINRTAVIRRILYILFENSIITTYRDAQPDVRDCEVCLGYFCSKMIEEQLLLFSYNDFFVKIQEFCSDHAVSLNIKYLFDVLDYNRIIVPVDNQLYQFRYSFWVYYFAAMHMHDDIEFANRILTSQNYLKYPEILEYYTGKERKSKDAVDIVTSDLSNVIDSVIEKSGADVHENPFGILRFNQSEEASKKIIQELEDNVQVSNLPQEIKDSVKDLSYNPSEAFHQSIRKIYHEYSVGHLIKIIEIASKVLRNSDYVKTQFKQSLLDVIVRAWKTLSTFIYLVSPSFAKNGYVELGGFSFKLCEGYDRYETDEERAIQIIVNIPRNMMLLFKDDLFSIKLSDLLTQSFKNETDKMKKHLLACLLIYQQPNGWDGCIMEYINRVGKDSYYLGTMIDLMQDIYYLGELDASNRSRMKNLLKTALYKSQYGQLPSSGTVLNRLTLQRPNYEELPDSLDEES